MKVRANGIEIEVETMGEGEPLILIMGIGAQLVLWPDDFCARLSALGFTVIRMDNRDIGMSTHLRHLPVPDPRVSLVRAALGLRVDAPYTLGDMADDVAAVLDALGHRQAHIVGASMGGMIAQTFAILHPERTTSLTSIMSTPGDARYAFGARPSAIRALLGPLPRSRDEASARMVRTFRALGNRSHPPDEDFARSWRTLLRSRCEPRRIRATDGGDLRLPEPACGARQAHDAHARDPWDTGSSDSRGGRASDRTRNPERAAARARRHGSRSASTSASDDRERDPFARRRRARSPIVEGDVDAGSACAVANARSLRPPLHANITTSCSLNAAAACRVRARPEERHPTHANR